MSGSRKKETTNTTNVVTPTNPQWVTDSQRDFTSRINQLGAMDPAQFTPGASALQQQAFAGAGSLGQASNASYNQAGEIANGVAGAGPNTAAGGSLLDSLSSYMNPGTQAVVDTTLQGFDVQAARTRAAQDAQAGRDRAFGGSGYAISSAVNAADSDRNRAATEATLRSGAFDKATGLALQDRTQMNQSAQFNAGQHDNALTRQLQAAGLLQENGTLQGSDQRANLGLLADLGGQQRDIATQQAQAPLDMLRLQSDLYNGVPFNLFNGSSQTGTGKTTQTGLNVDFMKLGQAIAASDVRVKKNITPLGAGPMGDNLYGFNYVDEPEGAPPSVGPIAQEVAQTKPWAVEQAPGGGPLMVDYSALGLPTPAQQHAGQPPPPSSQGPVQDFFANYASAGGQAPGQPATLVPDNDPLDNWDQSSKRLVATGQQSADQQRASQQTRAIPRARPRGLFGRKV